MAKSKEKVGNLSSARHFLVFYSWQSDSPAECNKNLIRKALRLASSDLEDREDLRGFHVQIDEATRDEAGSPSIPATIFRKIAQADVFVGDLTTANPIETNPRFRTPNKNVLLEAGYAAALLGWQRMIVVVNTSSSTFPDDLPFDIQQNRSMTYEAPSPSGKLNKQEAKQWASSLAQKLVEAIALVILKDPARPVAVMPDKSAVKRQRDIRTIKDCLVHFNMDIIDELLDGAPRRIPYRSFYFWEGFNGWHSATATQLYDKRLRKEIEAFHKLWSRLLSFYPHYHHSNDHYHFWTTPGDAPMSEKAERDYTNAEKVVIAMAILCKTIIKRIKKNYPEVDLTEELANSWAAWRSWEERTNDRLGIEQE